MNLNETLNATSTATATSACPPGTDDDILLHESISFWLEGVLETFICITGLVANCVAIPVLCSKKLFSIFNMLLVSLTVCDNLFILCCISEAVRKFFVSTDVHVVVFVYFLYQLQNVALTCSIYMTVMLAVERYIAVTRPIEYHLMVNAAGSSPWKRVAAYVAPTVVFGALFNAPKFFELETVRVIVDAETNETAVSISPTELRLDEDYVFYYVNLARFLVTGIFPFGGLVFLNRGIHQAIKKRRCNLETMRDHQQSSSQQDISSVVQRHQQQQQQQQVSPEERRQTLVLFAIVVLFLVCNVPRIVLNTYEVFTVHTFRENLNNACYRLPLWVMLTTTLSLLLMSMNSSINFFIYCFINPAFRAEILSRLPSFSPCLVKDVANTDNSNTVTATTEMTQLKGVSENGKGAESKV